MSAHRACRHRQEELRAVPDCCKSWPCHLSKRGSLTRGQPCLIACCQPIALRRREDLNRRASSALGRAGHGTAWQVGRRRQAAKCEHSRRLLPPGGHPQQRAPILVPCRSLPHKQSAGRQQCSSCIAVPRQGLTQARRRQAAQALFSQLLGQSLPTRQLAAAALLACERGGCCFTPPPPPHLGS